MDYYACFLTIHSQNKIWYVLKYVLLNNDIIFTSKKKKGHDIHKR